MYDDVLTVSDTFNGIQKIYNLTKKEYLNGIIKFKKTSFLNIKGLSRVNRHNGTYNDEQLDRCLKKRVKDRKEKIIDLALNNNNWQYFITLTFDVKQVGEPYTHEKAIQLLTKWINNQKHQNINMSYLLVSEFHKKSGHLHFHGLVSNVDKWKLSFAVNPHTNKKIIKDGVQIYNLDNYRLGFTTVSKIKDSNKVSYYLSKYITKEIINIKNKKTFWYSRDLQKPIKTYHHIDTSLEDYVDKDKLSYYDKFDSDNRTIELAEYKEQHNI